MQTVGEIKVKLDKQTLQTVLLWHVWQLLIAKEQSLHVNVNESA